MMLFKTLVLAAALSGQSDTRSALERLYLRSGVSPAGTQTLISSMEEQQRGMERRERERLEAIRLLSQAATSRPFDLARYEAASKTVLELRERQQREEWAEGMAVFRSLSPADQAIVAQEQSYRFSTMGGGATAMPPQSARQRRP